MGLAGLDKAEIKTRAIHKLLINRLYGSQRLYCFRL